MNGSKWDLNTYYFILNFYLQPEFDGAFFPFDSVWICYHALLKQIWLSSYGFWNQNGQKKPKSTKAQIDNISVISNVKSVLYVVISLEMTTCVPITLLNLKYKIPADMLYLINSSKTRGDKKKSMFNMFNFSKSDFNGLKLNINPNLRSSN